MSDNLQQSLLLTDLPFDVLLEIFSECDVDDVLNLSTTCKRLNKASGEHQTWLNQLRRLQIPIPTGVIPSMTELKGWVISWLRSDKHWVKSRDDDDSRSLSLHCFTMPLSDDDDGPGRFVMANLTPGGRFVVILYTDGHIDLKEINIKSKDDWELREVAQYIRYDPEGFYTMYLSQLLTETNLGRPLVAYVDRAEENLFVFVVDHIAGTIEQKQVVNLSDIHFYELYNIHARGNIILCFYEHIGGWGIAVSELGPDPALRLFNLSVNEGLQAQYIQFFMVSENAVVLCDTEGIYLYHIPELSSAENFSTLKPTWEWRGESKWLCGSICMKPSQHPTLYLQEASAIHTIVFRMDVSGRDSTVAQHRIDEGLPAYFTSPEEENDHLFVMKGRKGLYYNIREESFDTRLLGIEEFAGGFDAELVLPDDGSWDEQEVRIVDFDERTGRILIGTNRSGEYSGNEAIRIYLADLPP